MEPALAVTGIRQSSPHLQPVRGSPEIAVNTNNTVDSPCSGHLHDVVAFAHPHNSRPYINILSIMVMHMHAV